MDLQRYDVVARRFTPPRESYYADELQFFYQEFMKNKIFIFFVPQGSKEMQGRDLMGPEK